MPEKPRNLTKAGLAGAAVFTSDPINMMGTELLRVLVVSDVAGTLSVEQSADGAAFFETLSQAVAAAAGGKGTLVESASVLQLSRIKYTNGAAATGAGIFRIDIDTPRTD